MRLLLRSNSGEVSLTKNLVGDDTIPPYAILSHTWEADGEEFTFKDLTNGTGKGKTGFNKIRFCGEQARRDGLRFFWVDTCCIDKSNNVELQEAINSMFRWFQNAAKCYVYLSDVLQNVHISTLRNTFPSTGSFGISYEFAFRCSSSLVHFTAASSRTPSPIALFPTTSPSTAPSLQTLFFLMKMSRPPEIFNSLLSPIACAAVRVMLYARLMLRSRSQPIAECARNLHSCAK